MEESNRQLPYMYKYHKRDSSFDMVAYFEKHEFTSSQKVAEAKKERYICNIFDTSGEKILVCDCCGVPFGWGCGPGCCPQRHHDH